MTSRREYCYHQYKYTTDFWGCCIYNTFISRYCCYIDDINEFSSITIIIYFLFPQLCIQIFKALKN